MTEKRFTVPDKYQFSHSKVQLNGEPLTNDEIVRVLNVNDGAFVENFNLKKENNALKQSISDWQGSYDELYKDNLKLEKENQKLKKEEELFFGQVFDILLKCQDLFNREMADEVLEELGIELTRWFE